MQTTGYLVASKAGMFKSGLYGWVREWERGTQHPTEESAQAYIDLHREDQRENLFVWEVCEWEDGTVSPA